jgi:glycerate-2-kinase
VSGIKGGRLAQAASPARVISLIVSDVVGDPVESIASGPTSLDPSTFQDAAAILRKYGIYDRVPPRVRSRIEKGLTGQVDETPKPGDPLFKRVTNLVIGSNRMALEAAKTAAEGLGYETLIITDRMEGEAREMGIFAASILNSIGSGKLPLPPPCLVMMGGETTVTLVGPGDGGRNQELALSASRKISGPGLLLSLATDGRDGPTDSAGALVDRGTCRLAEQIGLSPERAIAENAEYELLKSLGCHLFTGHTGTNVCDVVFILVP